MSDFWRDVLAHAIDALGKLSVFIVAFFLWTTVGHIDRTWALGLAIVTALA